MHLKIPRPRPTGRFVSHGVAAVASNLRGMSQNWECVGVACLGASPPPVCQSSLARALKPVQFVLQQLHFSCVEGGKKNLTFCSTDCKINTGDRWCFPTLLSINLFFFFTYPHLFISPPPAFVLVFASDFASILFFFSTLFYQVRRLTKSTECHFLNFFFLWLLNKEAAADSK